jgi:integrase
MCPKCPMCPECGSSKIYKDGLRYLANGETVQRYLCRDCGYRFSKPIVKGNVTGKFNETFNSEKNQRKVRVTSRNPSVKKVFNGLPFLFGEDVASHNISIVEKGLNSLPFNNSKRRVCAQKDAKNLDTATETKTVAGESPQLNSRGKIIEHSFWLLKQGYSEATIKSRIKRLNRLLKLGADFNNEDSVKVIIATQEWSVSSKVNAVDAYDSLLRMIGKKWTPPIYRRVRKLPFIPTETEIDQLIAGCSKKMSSFLQLLKETGMRCGEACQLKWTDIDLISKSVRITPEKGGNPRNLKLSSQLVDMLNEMPKETISVFTYNTDVWIRNFARQRKRIAFKTKNSRLGQITFHTFRHWKATMEYHKTKDILHVKEILGHKSLNSTMLYTQLINFKDDDYTARVAHSEDEACKLIESGFEFVCDFDGNKLFRKLK